MNYKFKIKPYAHQTTALEKSWNKETYAYFMEMGTGKTKVLIDNLAMLYDKGKVNGALIVAPKGVIGTWYNQELPAHLPDHIEHTTVLWQPNITKTQNEKLKGLFKTGEKLHILIMNVESFSTSKGKEFALKFLISHNALMAIDESTTIKNPSAKRTKNIIELSSKAKYRRILTGSPVTKNPLDLYSQCQFLSSWLLDFSSYYAFRNRYAEMKTLHMHGRSIQVVDKFKNLAELSDTLKNFSYRVLKEDCLDLPPKVFIKRQISLSPDQRKLYEQMKKEALAILNGKQVTTVNALTQLMRLHQITCGHFTADDGTTQRIPNNRVSELMDILEETEGKAIIWAHYQWDIKDILKEITKAHGPDSVVDYFGLTPQDEDREILRNFSPTLGAGFLLERLLQAAMGLL